MAMRCRATLSWRLPPRLRRCRCWLPDQTGIGAVPLCMAKAALEWNRRTSAVSAISLAAVNPAQPGKLTRLGASSPARTSIRRWSRFTDIVNSAHLFQHHSPGQAAAGNLQPRFQLVKMPEEAVLNSSSLSNQVFPVVDQELELAAFAFQPGHRKIRLPERNPRHCHSVDWIRLAQLPARAP